ncbi:hypothetical protein F5883DRAFT_569522 [Diaporthe sp. PMI_573]|nr:hypothetical protein F5883DRAFT_569522 [Diaporthaceae sp. PMI_573]
MPVLFQAPLSHPSSTLFPACLSLSPASLFFFFFFLQCYCGSAQCRTAQVLNTLSLLILAAAAAAATTPAATASSSWPDEELQAPSTA